MDNTQEATDREYRRAFCNDIRQMMRDWDVATDAQREAAMKWASELAAGKLVK